MFSWFHSAAVCRRAVSLMYLYVQCHLCACQGQDKKQQAQIEIQEILSKLKKNFFTLRVVVDHGHRLPRQVVELQPAVADTGRLQQQGQDTHRDGDWMISGGSFPSSVMLRKKRQIAQSLQSPLYFLERKFYFLFLMLFMCIRRAGHQEKVPPLRGWSVTGRGLQGSGHGTKPGRVHGASG